VIPRSARPAPHPQAPLDVLARLRDQALDGSELLLRLDPVLGEPQTQRLVDETVEAAADGLRAIAELCGARVDVESASR